MNKICHANTLVQVQKKKKTRFFKWETYKNARSFPYWINLEIIAWHSSSQLQTMKLSSDF